MKEHNKWMPISNIEVYLELKTKGDFFHLRILLNNPVILEGTSRKDKLQLLVIMNIYLGKKYVQVWNRQHIVTTCWRKHQLVRASAASAIVITFNRTVVNGLSPLMREFGFRNAGNFCLGNLGSGIRNTGRGIRNPTNDWNPESKFHLQSREAKVYSLFLMFLRIGDRSWGRTPFSPNVLKRRQVDYKPTGEKRPATVSLA